MHQIVLITGPPGVGKSAVSRALCERFDRMLHVDVDVLRGWVRAGYRHPWAQDEQAREQRLLAIRNASAIALECSALRYACLIDDTALSTDIEAYRAAVAGAGAPVHAVTLLPSLEVARSRGAGRDAAVPGGLESLHAASAGRRRRGSSRAWCSTPRSTPASTTRPTACRMPSPPGRRLPSRSVRRRASAVARRRTRPDGAPSAPSRARA